MSHDNQAPSDPTPSPSSTTSSGRSFLDRFSRGSFLSLSSIKTSLPRYEAFDSDEIRRLDSPISMSNASPTLYSPVPSDGTWDMYSGSPTAESELWTPSPPVSPVQFQVPRNEATSPPRYSLINPRNSIILPWIASSAIAAASHDPLAGPAPRTDAWQASDEFRYSFTINSNRPWATLHLYTRDAVPGNIRPSANQPEVPRIWGCDPIAGMLQLEFETPQTIQQINIMLKGKIATSSLDEGSLPFLSHEFTVWKRSFGDPLQYTSTNDSTPGLLASSRRKFDGKFMGEYSFPFSFPFPTHVDPLTKSAVLSNPHKTPRRNLDQILDFDDDRGIPLPASTLYQTSIPGRGKNRQRSPSVASTSSGYSPTRLISRGVGKGHVSPEPKARLQPENNRIEFAPHASPMPPTFLEKDVSSEISYEISAVIHRGIFKNNSRIKTNISYLPATQPLPASQKRRRAYATGALIPGPMNDSDGWLALPTTTIEGEFTFGRHGQRYAEIECTLYLAQPLSYTRGTVLPCFLTFTGDDVELLDYLARPDTPVVRLMRRVRHFTTETRETRMSEGYGPLSPRPAGLATFNDKEALKTVLHEVDTAVWWVPAANEVPQGPYARHLDGEIHISEDLQPSCDCKIFHIEYFVEMLSLYTDEFQPDPRPEKARVRQEVIASTPVEITTLCRQDEPVPIPFSEPQRPSLRRISLESD